jgi:hypothetical protein
VARATKRERGGETDAGAGTGNQNFGHDVFSLQELRTHRVKW